jgi:hypothetical protein
MTLAIMAIIARIPDALKMQSQRDVLLGWIMEGMTKKNVLSTGRIELFIN